MIHAHALGAPNRSTPVICHKSLVCITALVKAEGFPCLDKTIVLLREMLAPVALPASLSGGKWAENCLWYVGWDQVPPQPSWDVRNNIFSSVMWNMFWGTEVLSVTQKHKAKGKGWPVQVLFICWIYILATLNFEPQLHPHLATILQLCRRTCRTAQARKRHVFNKLFWHFYTMAFVFITADHHCAHCKSIKWMWSRS